MTAGPLLPSGMELERALEAAECAAYLDFYEALPEDLKREFGLEASRDGHELRLTAAGIDHPFFNRVMGVGLSREIDRARIDAHAKHFRDLGIRRFMLQVLPHVETEGLRRDFRRAGFERLRGWAKHVGAAGVAAEIRTELEPRRIGPEHAGAWARICAEGFSFPPALQPWLAATVGRPSWHHYLAFAEDAPAATGALFVHGHFATLSMAATAPAFRERGAQSGLIALRIAEAATLGCPWVVSETDEELPDRPNPSYRNLIRLGLPVRYVRANWGPPKPE